MIFYFTGTGNSEYVAKRIGSAANDTVLNLAQFLPASKTNTFSSKTPWVIVAPIYAWRIPRVVSDWFSHAELTGNQKVFCLSVGDCSIVHASPLRKGFAAGSSEWAKGVSDWEKNTAAKACSAAVR